MELVSGAHQTLSRAALEGGENREEKIKACRTLAEHVPGLREVGGYDKVLAACTAALLRIHADTDMALWPVAEESLWTVLRALAEEDGPGERLLVELFKAIRPGAEREKIRRVALMRFGDFCGYLQPTRCRRFAVALLPVLQQIIEECSEPLLEALAGSIPKILDLLAYYCKEREIRDLITSCCNALAKGPSAACKRACGDIVGSICAVYPRPEWAFSIMAAQPLLRSDEASVVQGGLILLTSLAREAALLTERPLHRDPRAVLAQFGADLLAEAEKGVKHPAPLVRQAGAELSVRLAAALPGAGTLLPADSLRAALRALAFDGSAGTSRRAAALQGLVAWGGVDDWPEDKLRSEDEDPLIRGTALLALAKKGRSGIDNDHVILALMKDTSSVVARLAFEAAGEILLHSDEPRPVMEQTLVFGQPCEYWVVERQRLGVIGSLAMRWSSNPALRVGALEALFVGLENSDPRIRAAAAESLASAAPHLGPHGPPVMTLDNDTVVLEGAWRAVPAIMRTLLKKIRSFNTLHELMGLHQAFSLLAWRWCSPRRYLKKESARLTAAQQRPLHSSWPSPVQEFFSSYAARAVAEMLVRPSALLLQLDHHLNVLRSCASLARGGGAAKSSSWPPVLLHCLRIVSLYEFDPMDLTGDDIETLHGGGVAYAQLQARINSLRSSSLPSETGPHFDLIKAALKVIASLCKDVGRPITTFGHLILAACRTAMPLVPSSCIEVCRAIAPLCFRPATSSSASTQGSSSNPLSPGGMQQSVMSPSATAPTPATVSKGAAPSSARKPQMGLTVPPGLAYASGLGRPAPMAEDFPAALNFSASQIDLALRVRPSLPGLLEPLVLRAMEAYPKHGNRNPKVQARTLDLVVTLVRCGVDYKRLDPSAALVAAIRQQILGKRSYLKDPVRIMPSMYTFLGVLVNEKGPVDGEMLMQVAAPVFSSPYWRNNAKLLPALRWLLRDLVVRRRMQLQRSTTSGKVPPDVFADVRAHFISCLVSKLPHVEAVEQLEALLRSARPEQSLVNEIALPTRRALLMFASSGSLILWRPSQWSAWRTLCARIMQQKLPPLDGSETSVAAPAVSLDPEDPDSVFIDVCAPLGKIAGLLLLQRLGVSVTNGQDESAPEAALMSQALESALSDPRIALCAGDLLMSLRREIDPVAVGLAAGKMSGAKRSLFSDLSSAAAVPPESSNNNEDDDGPDNLSRPGSDDEAASSTIKDKVRAENLDGDAIRALLQDAGMLLSSKTISGLERPELELILRDPSRINLKVELPLLKVEAVSASMEIPDELYPLPTALYAHSRKLLYLRSLLSRAELDQILLSAEALAIGDPDRGAATDRALECLRGAILRPASVSMQTSSSDVCPRNDTLKIAMMPLWKLEDEHISATALADNRVGLWRRALALDGVSDEEDSLIGMIPASVPQVLPGPPTNMVKAYGIVCRLLRSHPDLRTAAVQQWARQWLAVTKVAALQQSLGALLASIGDGNESVSSMDSHETADMMLRSANPQVYCVNLPKLLLGDAFSPLQVVSLLFTSLIRCVRDDIDLDPICHTMLRVLPQLTVREQNLDLHLYVPALREACSEQLFSSLCRFLLRCVTGRKLEAHRMAHSLMNHSTGSLEDVCAELASQSNSESLVALMQAMLEK